MSRPRIAAARILLPALAALAAVGSATAQETPRTARGAVFHDRDGDRVRDPGEPGIGGVRVSNGVEIAVTDAEGRYALPVSDDTVVFVIKPRGWQFPLNDRNLPQFHHVHKPAGSPPSRFPGVAPTGELPEPLDFALYPRDEPDRFEVLLFGDTQPRNVKEVDYLAHDVVEEVIGIDAAFGVTLGDLVFDDLDVLEPLNRVIGQVGIPWHNVIGNHDLNQDAEEDHLSDETYERIYGPAYYSFDYGAVHFLALDDVLWRRQTTANGEERGGYIGGLGPRQLAFIENDLQLVPGDRLVVLLMHIPLTNAWHEADRQALFRLLERRERTFSVSAHAHWQGHAFLGWEDGWRSRQRHHHLIQATACGSWWRGEPDERGIPHALMAGGAPNGYSIVTFDGSSYSVRFKAAGKPVDHQMRIHAPEEVVAGRRAEVLVNVFAGSDRSLVQMRVGPDGPWVRLHRVARPDPYYVRLKQLEAERGVTPGYLPLPGIRDSRHLWRGLLPDNLDEGAHVLEVRTTDMFGQTWRGRRIVRVRGSR